MSKYYIGLLPEQNLSNICLEFKNQAEERFDCHKAKTSPAHVTLVPPFAGDRQGLALIKSLLSTITPKYTPFELAIQGWNHFKEKTIFLEIETTPRLDELIKDCYDYLTKLVPTRCSKQFVPHISIINRDLASSQFATAFEYFSLQPTPARAIFTQLAIFELIEGESKNHWQKIAVYTLDSGLSQDISLTTDQCI